MRRVYEITVTNQDVGRYYRAGVLVNVVDAWSHGVTVEPIGVEDWQFEVEPEHLRHVGLRELQFRLNSIRLQIAKLSTLFKSDNTRKELEEEKRKLELAVGDM